MTTTPKYTCPLCGRRFVTPPFACGCGAETLRELKMIVEENKDINVGPATHNKIKWKCGRCYSKGFIWKEKSDKQKIICPNCSFDNSTNPKLFICQLANDREFVEDLWDINTIDFKPKNSPNGPKPETSNTVGKVRLDGGRITQDGARRVICPRCGQINFMDRKQCVACDLSFYKSPINYEAPVLSPISDRRE